MTGLLELAGRLFGWACVVFFGCLVAGGLLVLALDMAYGVFRRRG